MVLKAFRITTHLDLNNYKLETSITLTNHIESDYRLPLQSQTSVSLKEPVPWTFLSSSHYAPHPSAARFLNVRGRRARLAERFVVGANSVVVFDLTIKMAWT